MCGVAALTPDFHSEIPAGQRLRQRRRSRQFAKRQHRKHHYRQHHTARNIDIATDEEDARRTTGRQIKAARIRCFLARILRRTGRATTRRSRGACCHSTKARTINLILPARYHRRRTTSSALAHWSGSRRQGQAHHSREVAAQTSRRHQASGGRRQRRSSRLQRQSIRR